MATEETTISDLELTEDILPDMLVPVENSSETKATTFSAIKNWLNGFFVGKTGDETISGIKTFAKSIISTQNNRVIQRNGSDGNTVSTFESNDNGNSNRTGIYAFSEDGASNISLILHYNDGRPYALFSSIYTLNDFDNSTKVATTNFVLKHGISAKGDKYVKLGDGTIIQWGRGEYNKTVTLPTPFSSVNYVAFIVDTSLTSTAVTNLKTTSFEYNTSYGNNRSISWFAVGR